MTKCVITAAKLGENTMLAYLMILSSLLSVGQVHAKDWIATTAFIQAQPGGKGVLLKFGSPTISSTLASFVSQHPEYKQRIICKPTQEDVGTVRSDIILRDHCLVSFGENGQLAEILPE